jgi:AhpD family alkylhydroperoxidase
MRSMESKRLSPSKELRVIGPTANNQQLKYTELAPAGVAAMRAVEHYCNTGTGLEPVLLELVRLRASLLNGCEDCIGVHTHHLTKHNETPERIARMADWRGFDGYTERERAALAWTEVITDIQQGHAADADYEAALQHFSETELVNLTIAIASINAWNRLGIAFRAQHLAKPNNDDGGKVTVED